MIPINPPFLINGLAISHNESFFIFDFRADVTLTYKDSSQDIEEIHDVILIPKDIAKTISEMLSQNIKKYEKTFKKLDDKKEIINIEHKESKKDKKENYFG